MPIVIAVLTALAAVYFFVIRARGAAEMTTELLDVANDVRAAARRFGFRRRRNHHPVEDIDEPNLAVAALGVAYLDQADFPTAEDKQALSLALQSALDISLKDAEEMMVLGRWLTTQCGTADAAITRLSKRLYGLKGAEALQPLMEVLQAISHSGDSGLGQRQREALDDIKRIFRLR